MKKTNAIMLYCKNLGFYRLETGYYANVTTRKIFKRLQEASEAKSQADFAIWLNTKIWCIQDAKKRKLCPLFG